jgi:hypothetical protein
MSFDKVDSNVAAGIATDAVKSSGVKPITRAITFETEAADAAADIKALFKVGAHEIPLECWITCDAIAGLTDIDLGLYREDEVVVDADAFMDGTDLSAGKAFASRVDGLSALGVQERGVLKFFEIANDVATTHVVGALPNDSYWFSMTLNSEVSAAGTVTVVLTTLPRG